MIPMGEEFFKLSNFHYVFSSTDSCSSEALCFSSPGMNRKLKPEMNF